jgi:ribonuclease HII
MLLTRHDESVDFEIGVDEAGRGPMLGRVYAAAVVLPKDDTSFRHDWMKDSKRFHSSKRITEVAAHIKENAIAWHVAYATEQEIDKLNIRCATHKAMHEAIRHVHKAVCSRGTVSLLVDGNDFRPFTYYGEDHGIAQIPHACIEKGDNTYTCIAAASILAKVTRDAYIEALCATEPTLDERYGIAKNKGYGTKQHMEGIDRHGASPYHRRTFGKLKWI